MFILRLIITFIIGGFFTTQCLGQNDILNSQIFEKKVLKREDLHFLYNALNNEKHSKETFLEVNKRLTDYHKQYGDPELYHFHLEINQIYQELFSNDALVKATALYNLGYAKWQNDPESALECFRRSGEVLLKNPDIAKNTLYQLYALNAKFPIGMCHFRMRNYEKSIDHNLRYINSRVKFREKKLQYDLAFAHMNLSGAYFYQKNCDKALFHGAKALEHFKRSKTKPSIDHLNTVYNNIGAAHWICGNLNQAKQFFSKSKFIVDSLSQLNALDFSLKEDQINVRSHQLELICENEMDKSYLVQLFNEIDQIIRSTMSNNASLTGKRKWLKTTFNHYERALKVAISSKDPEIIESTLINIDKLRETSKTKIADSTTKNLKESIKIEHELYYGNSIGLNHIFQLKKRSLHNKGIIYAANKRKMAKIDFDISRRAYFKTLKIDSSIYLTAWNHNELKELIEVKTNAKGLEIIKSNSLINLYQLLLSPLHIPKNSTITIIPDAQTANIPFGALLTDPDDPNSFLEKDYTINYQLSATLMQQLEAKQVNTTGLAAFAPTFDDNPNELYASVRGAHLDDTISLYNLTHSSDEVKYITDTWDALSYTVTKDNVIDALKNKKIFHFAGHAVTYEEDSDYSFLALSSDVNNLDDKLLLKELYNLECNNEMVVLSACETGAGEIAKGEGVLSLARGFFYAGAKSVISTLWSVNDASSAIIMKEFYRQLRKGKRKDEALRLAKLHFLEHSDPEYHDPKYWAGFIAMGDMSPIFTPWWRSGWTYAGIGTLAIAGFLFSFRRRAVADS